jgi:ketosteroid isomerase-like protein
VDEDGRERARQVMLDLEVGDEWLAVIDPDSPEWVTDYIADLIDAYRNGDIDWAIEQSDPEIEIVQPPEFPDRRTYRGHDGVIEALLDWPQQWEDFHAEPKRIFAVDDEQFVVVAVHRGRSRRFEAQVEAEIVWLFTRRNQLTTRWDMFMSVEQALAAAASEQGTEAPPP